VKLDQKVLAVALALSAGFGLAACNEDKAASTSADKPAATAVEKAKEMAAKVEDKVEAKIDAAKEKMKDLAEKAAPTIDAAKEKMKAMAEKAGDKLAAAKDAAQPAAKDAAAAVTAATAAATAKVAEAAPEAKPEAKPADPAPAAATPAPAAAPAAPEAKPAEAAPAAKPAEAAAPATPATPAAPAAAAAGSGEDNSAIQAASKEAGAVFKDGRYRDKDGHPMPVATKDYKVDWATWQGFRRYHDACHVCHGPNALGSTFAPSLADSLKTMDYETFYGTVVGGRIADRGGTKYVMPAFGEDKNIMCYLDDIYTYIKARSLNSEGKGGMPPGRPNGREDISPEAKKAASDCTG
jgi:methanol metabolism-related c-type cytochrome